MEKFINLLLGILNWIEVILMQKNCKNFTMIFGEQQII